MNRGQAGEIDHPGQQSIIAIGIDAGQGGGADGSADQAEVDVGSRTVPPQGPGAVEDRGLHCGCPR